MTTGKQHKVVYYSGRVQGVGFRYTTCRIATQYEVAGFVRNLPDGRVELVVEGSDAAVSGFLQQVAATFADHVTSAQIEDGVGSDGFTGFEVRY